jgi:hypothetical protein
MRTETLLRPPSVLTALAALTALTMVLLAGAPAAEAGPRRPANPPSGRAPMAPGEEKPEPSREQEPSSISIRKRIGDAERARKERRERASTAEMSKAVRGCIHG